MSLISLENIHSSLELSKSLKFSSLVDGVSYYYHYSCPHDGHQINDAGWGCGYRTIQTISSWISLRQASLVPTLPQIQKALVDCEDKPPSFLNSKDWIGCFEAAIVIDSLFDIPCKVVHAASGQLNEHLETLNEHFKLNKSPIMMGGDIDNGSKCVLGIASTRENLDDSDCVYFLVADPHCTRKSNEQDDRFKERLIYEEFLAWKPIKLFQSSGSFYNFCLPQTKSLLNK